MGQFLRVLSGLVAYCLASLCFCSLASAKKPVTASGKIFRNLGASDSSHPVVLEYATPLSNEEKTKKKQKDALAVTLAKAPQTGSPGSSPVPTFASELSASVMNEDLRNKIDDEYIRKLKSFMYFHGYEATSKDARGRFHEIDPEQEIAVRQRMARSMRSYMLSRGIPKFLMSRFNLKTKHRLFTRIKATIFEFPH